MKAVGKKCIAVLLFCFSILCAFPPLACAEETAPYFSFNLDRQEAAQNDLVKLQIVANPMPDTAAGFRMIIGYDDSVLSFVRTETSSQIHPGTMTTNSDINPIYSVYVCNVDQKAAPVLSGNIISFVFKVKSSAQPGKSLITARIDEVCNYRAKQLNRDCGEDLSLNITPARHAGTEAYLTALEPLIGHLTPDFSPDTFQYSMHVGYDVDSVEFAASAGDGGTVRISRRTLGKAGTDTMIFVTVTSKDQQTKVQYAVKVYRNSISRPEVPQLLDTESKESPQERPKQSRTASSSQATAGEVYHTGSERKYKNSARLSGKRQHSSAGTSVEPVSGEAVQPPVGTAAAVNTGLQQNTPHGDRNVYIIGNQMPSYLVGMLVCAICVQIGLILSIWLKPRKKE